MTHAKRAVFLSCNLLVLAFLCLCLSTRALAAGAAAPSRVVIAYQPGIGYAPLIVLKEQRVLEKQFPHTTFDWRVLGNGATIRDGIIAGQIQFGAGGTAPFLIAWDKANFKLVAALDEMDLWLVSRDPQIHSLKDFTPSMKIGMPGIDSMQAIVLRKAAQEQLGNPHALDQNIVPIPHPLGLQALEHGELAAHLSSPPFEFEEEQDGGHVVLRSYSLFGHMTFIPVYTTQAFYNQYPAFVQGFFRDLQDANKFIVSHRKQTAVLLSRDANGKVPPAKYETWLAHKGIVFTTTPHGFLKFASFMHSLGLISKTPASIGALELPTLDGKGN